MKKALKVIIPILLVGIIAFLVIRFAVIGGSDIREGTYKSTQDEYKDVTATVKDGMIQFHNIDLNAIFQEAQLNVYEFRVKNGSVKELTNEQLEQASDLNLLFVDNPYPISETVQQSGTFIYMHPCIDDYFFGLLLEYDAFHKTLKVFNGAGVTLEFQK